MSINARRSLPPQMARLFAAQARLYCISALIAGLPGIISLTVVSMLMVRGAGEGELDPRAIWQSMSGSHQLMAVFGLLFAIWTPILLAARSVCRITANQLSGRPLSLATVLEDMARFIPPAFFYSIVIGFPTMIGATILFIPGMVIAALFVLVVPAGVSELSGTFAALRRGLALGNRIFVKDLLATLAGGALVGLVVLIRIVLIDRFLPGTRSALFALRIGLVYLPAMLVLILANIAYTLLYNEARELEARPPQ
jgi:hypothetical protein